MILFPFFGGGVCCC